MGTETRGNPAELGTGGRFFKRPLERRVIVTLLLMLAGLGAILYSQFLAPGPVYHYQPARLEPYSFTPPEQEGGLIFQKPEELTLSTRDSRQVMLLHASEDRSTMSYVIAAISPAGKVLTDAELRSIDHALLEADSDYKGQVFDSFVKSRVPTGWSVEVDQARVFQSSTVKSNAWTADVRATSPAGPRASGLTGRIIYAVQGENYYHFLVLARPDIWRESQAVWQQVLESLQVSSKGAGGDE